MGLTAVVLTHSLPPAARTESDSVQSGVSRGGGSLPPHLPVASLRAVAVLSLEFGLDWSEIAALGFENEISLITRNRGPCCKHSS